MIKDVSAIPIMTSNTAPFGVVSASSEFSTSYQAWIVFGQTAKNAYWSSKYKESPSWLSYEFPQAKRIIRYSILMESGVAYAPLNWTFEGYDEASGAWIVLDTRTQVSFVINVKQLYDFNNENFYKKYRINISKGSNTEYTYISKMEMFEPLPEKGVVLQDPTTNQQYSLSDRTLIHLPDSTNESIVEYGIEQGKFIQLDVPFTKHRYFNDTPVAGTVGVFTHDVGVIKTLSIKEFAKNKIFEPIFTWYETKMISDVLPSPLKATASSFYVSTAPYTYFPFRAFDGNISDISTTNTSCWATDRDAFVDSWLMLDFGELRKVNTVQLTPRNETWITQAAKEFKIESSTDGAVWNVVGNFDITDWQPLTSKKLDLSLSEGRYFRITHKSNNGGQYISWTEVKYGYKREVN
ncbi:discoidin domain-containing protein [Lysinibacillus sp. FSL M8-0216]|uniref:discoidin domain-containing protein n=1 Tax=Lysinibacillus sp. FSL M8-0216 TaxID=2921619 RepID=UPI00315B3D32